MRPTIEDAKRHQALHGLGGTHLVWLDETGYTLAHTDHERVCAKAHREDYLVTCPVNQWLLHADERPVSANGWYAVDEDRWPYEFVPLYGMCHCGSVNPHTRGTH